MKREIRSACLGFNISSRKAEELYNSFDEIVEQLGGKYGRKFIDVLIDNGVQVS
jgi:hypothetical protein